MGKKCPQENSEILLLFETSKNDHCRCGRWGCKCPCSQFYVPFSQKSKMPFYSQNCHFSRIALLFSRSAVLFPRSVFLFNVCLSNGFFPRWLYFLLVLLRALLRETIIALLLKPLHGVWFLMHFIQILFSMIVAWKMQFLRI